MKEETINLCEMCGQPMPEGEEIFRYHGYSCDCPNIETKKDNLNKNENTK